MQITITDTSIDLKDVPNYETAINTLLSVIVSFHENIVKKMKKEEPVENQEALEESIFEFLNKSCANMLDFVAPSSFEAYPDFTVEALRYVEDIYLKHLEDQIPIKDKAERKKKLEEYLAQKRAEVYNRRKES